MFYPGSLRRSLESEKPLVQVVEWVSSSQKRCTQRGTAGRTWLRRALITAAQQCRRGKLRMSVVGGAAGQRIQIFGKSGCQSFPVCGSVAAAVREGSGDVFFCFQKRAD